MTGTDAAARTAVRGDASATRERILSASMELFAEQGYAGTSIRDIAARLGMTKASLYYHFSAKEEILDALMQPLLEAFDDLLDQAGDGSAIPPSDFVARLVRLMVGPAAALHAVLNDPSVVHLRKKEHDGARFDKLVTALAGPGAGSSRVLRARCAIGALQAGIFGTKAGVHTAEWAAAASTGPGGPGAVDNRRLPAAAPVLSDQEQRDIVDAALAALG